MSLQGTNGLQKALGLALRFLALKGRTEKEVEEYLKAKGFADPIVKEVVERLKGWGYLDDKKAVREWARGKMERSLWGRRRLNAEMRKRGLDEELASEIVEELFQGVEEVQIAQRAAERYLRAQRKQTTTLWGKLGAYLARKGFPVDVIREVLRRRLAGSSSGWELKDEDIGSSD